MIKQPRKWIRENLFPENKILHEDVSVFFTRPLIISLSWAFLTLELAFAGLYSSELRKWDDYPNLLVTPLTQWLETPNFSLWFFMFSLVITVSVITFQRAVTSYRDEEASNKIHNGISMVQEMQRTLPPPSFAYEIGNNFLVLQATVNDMCSSTTVTQSVIKEGIRSVLDSINGLAKTFDEDDENDYAVNLMIHRDAASISDPHQCINNCIKFWPNSDLSQCSGILFLDKELSTSNADAGEAKPDSSIESNVALPIYKIRKGHEDTDERHLLPGAPRAFHKQEMIVIHSTDDLLAECEERNKVDIYQETIDQIKEYFEKTGIKSFTSLPIIEVEREVKCIGVVNIHKFCEGILRSGITRNEEHLAQKAKTQFYYLITPYLSLLPPLINKLQVNCESMCK